MTTEILNQHVIKFLKQFSNADEINTKWLSVSNQKKVKKIIRHPKDPSKPKRGKSGFLFFCNDMRPKLLEENEKMSVKEVVRELGRLWRELKSNGEVEKYENLSKQDRERYSNEMIGYKEQTKKANKSIVTTATKTKTPKQQGFQNYVKSKKHILIGKDPSLSDDSIHKILKEKWEKLPLEKQDKYKGK
jgi:hypothetical protein